MSTIAEWLRSLGMSEYAESFAENDIDETVLQDLTDQHLEKLGVSMGHRLKMLRAIGKLAGTARGAAQTAPLGTPPSPKDAAERRQLTVMFCDLVGSTALSSRLDPEDLREVISTYHKSVAEAVSNVNGFVAKYIGDGVVSYFGYPQADEDDAERAVRAGLEIVRVVSSLKTRSPEMLQVRIGVGTGLVVVGDLIGQGAAQEQAVVGETPNLAARLQTVATPNSVVIDPTTRRILRDLFEYDDLGPIDVKGFELPIKAYQVLRQSSVESRFEALRTTATPLVGRKEEIETLMRRWEAAKETDGSVVLFCGEPGLGKSRIAQAVQDRIATEPHTRLRYFCSPHHQDSALYPVISQLERAAGFRREDSNERRLTKLETILAQGTLSEAVPLLADLLSIPTDNRYRSLSLTPQKRKEKTLSALLVQVEGLASQQPVLMVFEDVHWIDPTTRELLDLLIERVSALRVLLIITYRPEFSPPWVGRQQVTLLTLNRLPPRQRAQIISGVVNGKALPQEITDQIIDRTDGIPLFIEELTKAVIESDVVADAGDRYQVTGPLAALAIPTSLHASLLARLDRLAPVREVAQIAAALGRQFSHELISAVVQIPKHELDSALQQLVTAELIFRRGTPPDAEYTFKHALVQEAAYSTLLRGRRQQLHGRIAGTLEKQFAEITRRQPELVARHCADAGLDDRAIKYWHSAGEQAVRRANNREAIRHFHQALALNERQPACVERSRTEVAILSQLGPALMSVYGWSAPEVGIAYQRAEDLARQLKSSADLAPPLAGLWLFHTTRGQFSRANEIVNELFNVAHTLDDQDILLQAHHCAWPIQWFRGKLADAAVHVHAGLKLYDELRHARHRFLYLGHDPAVCALSIGAVLQWLLGYPTQGIQFERDAINLARRLQHVPSLAHALWFVCQAQIARDDAAGVMQTASDLLTLSEEHGLPQTRAIALVYFGWAIGRTKDAREGIGYLEQGLAGWNQLGARTHLCFAICLLAETFLMAGLYERSMEQVNLAFTSTSEIGEQWCLPRIHMLHAQLMERQARPKLDAAEASARLAVDVARSHCAKGWELRAATRLARLWRDQGKRTEARDVLAPVYNWFTEGHDTPVLKHAKALLKTLV